jgi:hypothetical protein
MLGTAAAVFGTPFVLGMARPVAGLIGKGGLKAVGTAARRLGAGRRRGLAAVGAGYGLMQATGSEMLEQTYISTYGPTQSTEERLAKLRLTGNLFGGTAMVLGGWAGVTGKMPGLPTRTGGFAMKSIKYLGHGAAGPFRYAFSGGKAVAKHPLTSAFMAGGAVGATASAITQSTRFRGREGNIRAIRSAPMGGISPELQFSTNGLVFALHNNRRRTS